MPLWKVPKEAPDPTKLYLEVTPSNAEIIFTNKRETFRQGMELERGSHSLSVIANDYISQTLTISVDPLREKVRETTLLSSKPGVATLWKGSVGQMFRTSSAG